MSFLQIPIAEIKIPAERQRKALPNIEALADSIKQRGLINPITLTKDHVLIAGERRLEACKSLGWKSIPAHVMIKADAIAAHAIELEENIKREDIAWQERVQAIVSYHELRKTEPGWTRGSTAKALGVSDSEVSNSFHIHAHMDRADVAKASGFSVARGIVQRIEERKQANVVAELSAPKPIRVPDNLDVSSLELPGHIQFIPKGVDVAPPPSPILTADFCEWAPTYAGPRFNLIHCDFPYGVGADERDQGSARHVEGAYDDSPDDYRRLLACFTKNLNRFCAPSAHLIFWFSMTYYEETFDELNNTPFTIDPFPLVWHKSDNAGVLPDPNRGPRRTYETAFFGSRGDRKVVRAVASSFAGPTVRAGHMSEKPQAMLEHFFRMVVDEHTSLFDPTCGSGSALRAGRALGASSLLGLERDDRFADAARARLNEPTIALERKAG